MSLDQQHPELADEQAYIDSAYGFMDRMYKDVEAFGEHGRNDFEREAFDRWKASRLAALSDRFSPLVFGRIDRASAETYYIGRQHVVGEEVDDVIVVDWRAPVALTFYRADSADPMGLQRRRHFLIDGRAVLGISDDDLTTRDGGPLNLSGGDVLQAELRRQRTGTMRDIVATIQREQDVIIRAPLAGVVVVQGGPGTGKTAIGLHRASFLLYEHREHLSRHRVLVVGPNPTFMRYISQVLPSLGEVAVNQRTIDELAPTVFLERHDDRAAERLKGDARMATVLRRALDQKTHLPDEDISISLHGARVRLPHEHVRAEVQRLRASSRSYKEGRGMLRDALLMWLFRSYQRGVRVGSTSQSFEDVSKLIRADKGFKAVFDGAWPAVGAEALVRSVVASPAVLAAAGDGVFSEDEQATIVRGSVRRRWTVAERMMLDEAAALIEGAPERYGHIVVDEAQDLSPMQLRMLARRSRDGSMTILGDLGQSTSAWAHDDWSEILEHLPTPDGSVVEELTLGYRVAPAIMELAAAVLAEAAPQLRAPTAVRAEQGEVDVVRVELGTRDGAVARLAASMSAAEGAAALIVPDEMVASVAGALTDAGVMFGDAERDGLGAPLTLVRASGAKGLEFDAVVVVEPAAIVAQAGLRLLYIAVTRAMRHLVIVHADPLPTCLAPVAPAVEVA
jgi:DNA helicase IV